MTPRPLDNAHPNTASENARSVRAETLNRHERR
jgi:hypothetical protein